MLDALDGMDADICAAVGRGWYNEDDVDADVDDPPPPLVFLVFG